LAESVLAPALIAKGADAAPGAVPAIRQKLARDEPEARSVAAAGAPAR